MSPDFTTPSHSAFANDGPRRGVSSDFLAIHTGNAPATAFLTDPTTNDASQRRRFDYIQCMNCRLLVLNETDVRSIESRGNKKHLPAQRIHPDICAIPSHDPRPMMLRNLYGIDLGTSGLILKSQSREEILADIMIVLAFRENRVKNRDLRDIAWLVQQGVALPVHLISLKIQDHQRTKNEFTQLVEERLKALTADATPRNEFIAEMRQFSPAETVRGTLENPAYWDFLYQTLLEQASLAFNALK